ncbi:MAG TPA: hypothetical protein VED40_00815 [Azospirillaceae bacterium]|nr:hypothetical protein [Azospirillaceae bacterium]
MEGDWIATAVGLLAGAMGSYGFLPQLLKVWRSGDCSAISKRGFAVTVAAFALWVTYGVMIGSFPVVLFNCINFVLSGGILLLKIRSERRERQGGAEPVNARS